jgi:general stress protein 26
VDLVFTTNTETGKTTELEKESHVNISFYNGLNVCRLTNVFDI